MRIRSVPCCISSGIRTLDTRRSWWWRRYPDITQPSCAIRFVSLIQDHDVYITDWQDARMVPLSKGPFHFGDYVAYVLDSFRLLGSELHVLSVCQPTAPVLAAIALMAAGRGNLRRFR